MKNLFAILTIIVAFVSCSDKIGEWRFAPELQNVRDLMQEQPDSALKLLICFDLNEKANIAEMHEYQILLAEALYKNDYQQTNDSAVVAAASYYDNIFEIYPENKNLAFETARAHYYKAVGETEKDDIVEACEDYLEAADIMEATFPEIVKLSKKSNLTADYYQKTKFISLIYNRIGDLMYAECYCEKAVDNYKTSLSYAKWIDNSRFVAILLNLIGNSYNLGNLPDSALYYYRQALNVGSEYENLKSSIYNTTASIYYEKGLVDSAYLLVKKNLSSPDDFVIAQTYYTFGDLLFKEMRYDSASYYLKPCFERGSKLMKLSSAKMLSEMYERTGDKELVAFYNKYVSGNAISEINRSVKVNGMIDCYNIHEAEKREAETHHIINIFLMAIAVFVLSIVVAFIINRKQKKKLSNKIIETENIAKSTEIELENFKIDERRRKDLKQKLGSLNITEDFEAMKRKLEASDICKSLRLRFENGKIQTKNIGDHRHLAMTKNEINELMATADRCLPLFTTMLSENLGINKGNQPYCILQMLNFSTAEIAVLMNSSYSAVAKRMDSIRKNLQTEMGIADFLNDYCSDIYKTCHCN